jgi:GNAT superfamily N-acetyltransferase
MASGSGGDRRAAVARPAATASVEIRAVDPEHPDAQHCLAEYVAELNRRSTRGFDPSVGATALPHEVRPPAGRFFVVYLDGKPMGCGAVKHHVDAPAEIKRMWISPEARGLGLGRGLLSELEQCALAGGARVAHIETSAVLTEALALYRSTGWVEVPAFNDEPFADHWLEKSLGSGPEFDVENAREVLRRTPHLLEVMLNDLPDMWLHGRESSDAWSPYQVCGHLLHVEECDWIDRTKVILEHGTATVFEPVDRDGGFVRFAGLPVDELLSRFALARHANLDELSALLGPGDLHRRGVHPDFGEVTLAQLLATWTVHDLNHVHQIVKTMAKQYADAVGPWRAFLPLLDVP